jgi:DNA polymerase I
MFKGRPPEPGLNLPRSLNGRKERFEGPEKVVLADLLEFIKVHVPDVILLPYADKWVPLMFKKARCYSLGPTFSRSGWFKSMASK